MTTLPPDSEAVLQPNADAWDEEQSNLRQITADMITSWRRLQHAHLKRRLIKRRRMPLQKQNDASAASYKRSASAV